MATFVSTLNGFGSLRGGTADHLELAKYYAEGANQALKDFDSRFTFIDKLSALFKAQDAVSRFEVHLAYVNSADQKVLMGADLEVRLSKARQRMGF